MNLLVLAAQTAIPSGAPPHYAFDGQIAEWIALPPTLTLEPSGADARHGAVWIRQVSEGLLIAGRVEGPPPDFAATAAELPRKDHVDIWLAPPAAPELPPIAYGEQSQEVPTLESCGGDQKCRAWFQSVVEHRRLLSQTLLRRYSLAPAVAVETFGTAAYHQLLDHTDKTYRDDLKALAPAGAASFRSATAASGYTFEALVPWDGFPAWASLEVKDLRLVVEVYSAGEPETQPYATTSSGRRMGDASSFHLAVLEQGRRYRLTACDYPLEGRNNYGETGPALFLPQRADDVTRYFASGITTRPIVTYSLLTPKLLSSLRSAWRAMPWCAGRRWPSRATASSSASRRTWIRPLWTSNRRPAARG